MSMHQPSSDLPILGCAIEQPHLATHLDWIRAHERDVEIQDFCEPETLSGDWRAAAEAIRRELGSYAGRLGLHGPFIGFNISSKDAEIAAIVARRLDRGLDIAAHLGASQMVIHSPFDGWDDHNFRAFPDKRATRIAHTVETLGPVVARAGALGIELVIENIEDRDPGARAALAQAFGAAHVRLSVDTGHANYAHHATGAPTPAAFIAAAGDSLGHVHLQDTDGFADHHWHPGEGNIAWAELFAALRPLSGRPRLIIEVNDLPGLRRGADHLIGLGLAR
jgi:sugar phosphate isomerase/epimerase